MNADQIAEIRPVIREVVAGAPDTCATLEVAGAPEKWMQIVDRTINAAYPHTDHPEENVRSLGISLHSAKLVAWESSKFATFEFPELQQDVASAWIDAYFVRMIGCTEGEYHLDVTFEKL